MGNKVTTTVPSRRQMGKYLNKLPDWIFEPTPRIIINEAVLRIKDEIDGLEEDDYWDSSLESSSVSLETFSEGKKVESKCRRTSCFGHKVRDDVSRKSYCRHKAEIHKMDEIQEELRLLREQISHWVHPKVEESKAREEVSSTVKTPLPVTKNNEIPQPPPLPENLFSLDYENKTQTNVLKDISNVKLRPVTSTPIRVKFKQKPPDVRNELYDILKRRYAAMHSPAPSRLQDDMDDSDEENVFEPRLEMHNQVLVC